MFDPLKIKNVLHKASEEKWSYPQIFNALKGLGIERYETNVLTHEIKYVGGKTFFVEPPPEGFVPLTLGKQFNVESLKTALTRIQSGETTYSQFLSEIAAAGVPFYRVDMGPRTVTYHSTGRDKLVETVPDI
jgi:uncharacterized protein YbcV (DUF1398 family)